MDSYEKNKRLHERIKAHGLVTLISPHRKKVVNAAIVNVSLTGLLISNPSSPIDQSTQYIVKIHSPAMKSIYLSAISVWQKEQQIGMRITHYYLDSKDLLESFIADLKTARELVQLLNDGWLDYLFVDEQGNRLNVEYS